MGIGGPLASTELYDPATNTFTGTTPSMKLGRWQAAATLLPNGRVLIAGGYGNTNSSSTELYDPTTNSFAATTAAMNAGRPSPTATLLPNGKILIAGGQAGFQFLSSTELYTP
jgi:hypothetical protein